jgi:hypothetical protein
MKTLHVLLVTRNRLPGLISALASIVRIARRVEGKLSIQVTIQDNSDTPLPIEILGYFLKFLPIQYHKAETVLPMSVNWNAGLKRAINQNPDYIVVLADRRLLTANILNAVHHLEVLQNPFLCFDHQDVWVNAHMIIKRNHSHRLFVTNREALLAAIGSAQINWHFPMLFNCLVRPEFMLALSNRYGSFAEGSSPDINFLARIADIGVEYYCTYDSPCIVTNARHASTSNGSSALRTSTISHTEHTRLSGTESYPDYMKNFVTANIAGSLARYWDGHKMTRLLDPLGFFKSSLLELSYPKSAVAFEEMKLSLKQFCYDFSLSQSILDSIEGVRHSPASNQSYPIDSSEDLSNSPALDLLAQVETPFP